MLISTVVFFLQKMLKSKEYYVLFPFSKILQRQNQNACLSLIAH